MFGALLFAFALLPFPQVPTSCSYGCSQPVATPTKPAFSSPVAKNAQLRPLPEGVTEFSSNNRNVVLKRGTLLKVRNVTP